MAKKPYRPKLIGDPLRKFKQGHARPHLPTAMQKYLEKTMSEDHIAGFPFRASLFVSEGSNTPDPFFFEKARSLGYRFDNEWDFAHEQLEACFKLPDRVPQYVRDFEFLMRVLYSDAAIKKTYGDVQIFRDGVEKRMRDEMAAGKTCTFGVNLSTRVHGETFIR
jgi:hypothetical protein